MHACTCEVVDKGKIESMVETTTHELLAGFKSRLWSEV
jgi:hypothetical protein